MKFLIAEDDFTSRTLMHAYLEEYAKCDIAVNGKEAAQAVQAAIKSGTPYDLITLDVMMPEMDGHEALQAIREIEEINNIKGLDRCKVIMTTALKDSKNIMNAFQEGCEGYLVKPIDETKLVLELEKLGLLLPQD